MKIHSLIPGTFNPLHDGHKAIAQYCINKGEYAVYCVSMYPFDKSDIPPFSVRRKQFKTGDFVCTYEGKSLYSVITEYLGYQTLAFGISPEPGEVSINIGIDTLSRVNDLKYYDGFVHFKEFCTVLDIQEVSIRAFPRNGIKTIELHELLAPHVEFITDFEEVDISSTEIRSKQ